MWNLHGGDGPARRGLMVRAAGTSVLLSVLFLVVFGGTNWITAQRPAADVRTWYFTWELTAIPYVPLLIVPYMSLDVFFFLAPFLCRERRELRTFAKRVAGSILVAAAFFLLLPLRLDWPPRPHVDGWFGELIEQSCTAPFLMEYPHNLFPSLHIVLCLIVADVYGRHTRGLVRTLVYAWFFLIGIATMLTWQHHVVDVLGGLVLAGFAFYAFRESAPRHAVTANFRVGSYYAAGAAAILALAWGSGIGGVFLLWPAAALGITAGAYIGVGQTIFRKTNGRLPLCVQFVLAPILIGQYLSLVYYRRQCRAWDTLAPGVLLGRVLTDAEAAAAVRQGVTAVLDLTGEFSEATPFLGTSYLNLPILDLTAPTQDQLREAVAFIAAQAGHGTVYVHCKAGYSRSAAVVAAYLLATGQAATVEEAVALVRQARPAIIIRSEVLNALRSFASHASMLSPLTQPWSCTPTRRKVAA
jgi:protein-tyrosine phosphatase